MNSILARTLLSVALTLAATTTAVQAAPVVLTGSTYDFAVYGVSSGLTSATLTFDGLPETFTRTTSSGTAVITLNESQQDLGGGRYRILFNLLSTGELYPVTNEAALVAMGALGNPLDLLQTVHLDQAFVHYYDVTGAQQGLASFDSPQGSGPWNGAFFDNGSAGGLTNFGGRDTRGLQLELLVSNVPEPQTALLAGVALLGLFATRRRAS